MNTLDFNLYHIPLSNNYTIPLDSSLLHINLGTGWKWWWFIFTYRGKTEKRLIHGLKPEQHTAGTLEVLLIHSFILFYGCLLSIYYVPTTTLWAGAMRENKIEKVSSTTELTNK